MFYSSPSLFKMDGRKRNAIKLFEAQSDDSLVEDPYHDDGEYGLDHDYNPQGETSGSDDRDGTTVNRRQRGKKAPDFKLSAARRIMKPSRLEFTGNSNEASSSDENIYDRDNNSSDIQNSCGSSEIYFNVNRELLVASLPSQTRSDHNDGTGYDSLSSEEIFPLAKRLKKPTDYCAAHNDGSPLPSTSRVDTAVQKNYQIAVATSPTNDITVNTPTHLSTEVTSDANEKAPNNHGFHAVQQNASHPSVSEGN